MPELPQWMTTAILSVLAAGIGALANRRLSKATVTEKNANALSIMTNVADSLARQLQQVEVEVPVWKQRIGEVTARAETAERELHKIGFIREEARIIVEELSHMTYVADHNEEETPVARRFRRIKEAAKRIEEAA